MAKHKRPSLSERMAELFNAPKSVPPVIVPREIPSGIIQRKVMDVSPVPPGVNPYQVWGNREQSYHEKPPAPEYRGHEVKLPNGQSIYWNEFTPQHVLDKGLLTDPELIKWANQWTQVGGNHFAEMLYADRLWNKYGLWENQNLHPASKDYIPWSDRSHYFDWNQWKLAHYNALKG